MKQINDLIFEIRGKQVIFDSDVAKLYHSETKRINEVVKRNIARFPEQFSFRISEEEYDLLKHEINNSLEKQNWSQIATSSTYKHRGDIYLPYVFTEKGIIMLASLLKSDVAIEASVKIVEAFVEMKNFITNNADVLKRLTTVEYKLLDHDEKFDHILTKLETREIKERLFYNGQIYDAYSVIVDIIKKAEKEIVIVDNYINKKVLDILTANQSNVKITLFTKNNNLNQLDIDTFSEQYGNIDIVITDKFHDRWIIIDSEELYHVGASLKDLGKKCFGINKIEDQEYLEKLNKIISEHKTFC